MIDIHAHTQVGNFWRFKYSDPDLDEVPKFQVLIDFPVLKRDSFGEIFGYQFPIPVNSEDYLVKAYGPNWQTPISFEEHLAKQHNLTGAPNKEWCVILVQVCFKKQSCVTSKITLTAVYFH